MLKGIDFVFRVMERVDKGIRLHLRGAVHRGWKQEITKRLEELAGVVSYSQPEAHSKMPHFYRSLHALLQPSRFENFGLAYAEAMASGLVVFAGENGGGSEIIKHGRSGFLVDPDGPVEPIPGMLT